MAHGTSPALQKSADPQRGTSITTPVRVRPIGRTRTEVTAIQNNRESKPRSQNHKRAVPDNRSHPNRIVEDWGKYLGDNTMSTTILDRLMHRSALLAFEGKSYRMQQAATRLTGAA